MGSNPWVVISRLSFWRRRGPWVLILITLALVRLSKGAVFLEIYAFLSKPFWPGTAQQEWLENSALLEQHASLNLLKQDNQRLREMLDLSKASGGEKVAAVVIARTPQGWWQKVELSKGKLDGIQPGDPVVGPGGLIGIIESVTPTTSRVRLLTAPGSRIGVWVARNKHHGMLIGTGTNRAKLSFLDTDADVRIGDLVSTSPASVLLPPNLSVGIIQVLNKEALPAPYALVQLAASPEAIDWVQVLIR